jgi:hypothetical protein
MVCVSLKRKSVYVLWTIRNTPFVKWRSGLSVTARGSYLTTMCHGVKPLDPFSSIIKYVSERLHGVISVDPMVTEIDD